MKKTCYLDVTRLSPVPEYIFDKNDIHLSDSTIYQGSLQLSRIYFSKNKSKGCFGFIFYKSNNGLFESERFFLIEKFSDGWNVILEHIKFFEKGIGTITASDSTTLP